MQVFIQIYLPTVPDVKYSVLIPLSQSLIHDSSEDIHLLTIPVIFSTYF
jgi:hypothetical protein